MDKNLRFFSGILIFLVMVLGLWFVLAAAFAPTDLDFNNNITAIYDEGNFSLNWTAGGANETGYHVYIWVNDSSTVVLWKGEANDSLTGYSFNNWTETNYTFHVSGTDGTGYGPNSTNISMYVDRTAPVITLPVYTNGTAKKNTTQLTLNISVIDAKSGETGSVCLIDVNGTSNQSIAVSSNNWCNSTVINLTGTSDGNKTIKVYVNDTVNILGLNNSFVVQVDTTAPTASASCSPSSVTTGASFPCTCSGTDATSGVSTSLGSSTSNSITSTSNTGQFIYTCSVIDNAGNSATSTVNYIVEQTPGSAATTTTTTWTTHTITKSVFEQGYTKELGVRNRIKVQIEAADHFVGVISVSESLAVIEISSVPVQVTLAVGEDAKVDVTDDGFYDIYVLLNGITNNKADVTIQKIYEEVPEEGTGVEVNGEIIGEQPPAEKKGISIWVWILIIVIIAIVVWQMKTKKK